MKQSTTNIDTPIKQTIINIGMKIRPCSSVYKFISGTFYSFRFALLQVLLFSLAYNSYRMINSDYFLSRSVTDFIFLLCLCAILFPMMLGYTKAYTNLKTATKSLLILYPIYAILVSLLV